MSPRPPKLLPRPQPRAAGRRSLKPAGLLPLLSPQEENAEEETVGSSFRAPSCARSSRTHPGWQTPNFPQGIFLGGYRGPAVEAGPRVEAKEAVPLWRPELPVPPCPPGLPIPPWPPESPAPPWRPGLPDPIIKDLIIKDYFVQVNLRSV